VILFPHLKPETAESAKKKKEKG